MEENNFEFLKELLKIFSKTFICLRCGECCRNWAVKKVPGYNENGEWTGNFKEKGMKPEKEQCRHLIPATHQGKWKTAVCKIYKKQEFPEECRAYVLGPGYCPLGVSIWETRRKADPGVEIPDKIEEVLKKVKT